MKTALYARVSTTDRGQDPELQLRPLREYCAARGLRIAAEHVDYISGSKDRRAELDRLLDAARKRQIDCILVWKLDRFGRSLKHLITALDELNGLGVGFISYSENLDLSTASGRLMVHIIGAMAEFERELIRERVKAGIANARAKGKRHGRKQVAPIDRKKILDIHVEDPGLSVRRIAARVKMPHTTVHKTLSLFKAGKVDREGFLYERSLCT